jgi:hypothetical protein
METAMTGIFLAAMLFLLGEPSAQTAPAAPDIALQREKMAALSIIAGEWRGEGWMMTREGRVAFTQTEVVKPALGGNVLTINGTGRGAGQPADAEPVFQALAIVSYDERSGKYMMRSYAQGRAGDFEIRPRAEGLAWSLPNVEYDAVVMDGVWTEKGFYKGPDGKMTQFIEFTVRRVD